MTYSHSTQITHDPSIEFWRSLEILLSAFPYNQGNASFLTKEEFIVYYETKYHERFDTDFNDTDIYGKSLIREFIIGRQKVFLDQMSATERNAIQPDIIQRDRNYLGRIIKFLSDSIKNQERVHKFQHFIEAIYFYLVEIHELNPNLPLIRQHGLENRDNAQFQTRYERFRSREGGLLNPTDFKDKFNEICLIHEVPFLMVIIYDKCFVIHTTDIFVEKIIQSIPIFLIQPELQEANRKFIDSYVAKSRGEHKECLAKVREGLELIRDYIFDNYHLTPSTSVHNDFEQLFNNHSSVVFNFTRIPEDDPVKRSKIENYIRDTILLVVKMGNFGHHTISRPQLLDENTSNLSLGLIASIVPYIIYLLK